MKRILYFILFAFGGRRYIPAGGGAFCDWAGNAVVYCRENCSRWGISPPEEGLEEEIDDLKQRVIACAKSATKAEVAEKNAMRRSIETYLRGYLQGMVARNPSVTDADRLELGLHVPDAKPTHIGRPVGQATAIVKYPIAGSLELRISPVDADLFDVKANYGVKIAYGVFPLDAPVPDDVAMLHRSRFTRRKKELFSFEKRERERRAVFCLRYENSKGEAGDWGPFVTAVIP